MTRFTNLEYDEPEEVGSPIAETAMQVGTSEAVKPGVVSGPDETTCCLQGQEQYELGQFEPALRYYSRALEFNPQHVPAWVGQCRMLLEMGELTEAEMWAGKSLELFRNHPELLAVRAVANCRLGRREKALQFSDASFEQPGAATPCMWLARGEVLLATKGTKAAHCFSQVIGLAGPLTWFWTLLVSRIYYFYREPALAMQHAREALDLRPANPFVWFHLGHCQRKMRLYRKARESYQQAIKLLPNYKEAQAALNSLNRTHWLSRLFSFG